jgi:hypothetical protein
MEHHLQIFGSKISPSVDYNFYFEKIIPKFIIKDGVPEVITDLHEKYHLEGFMIKTIGKKLLSVMIYGRHPNVDINTDELCLKVEEKRTVVTDIQALKDILINRLQVWYFNDCHFRPDEFFYKTKPVDGFMKIDVNFKKGEIYDGEAPFRRIYPTED